jgi:hypothetical protein
VRDFFLRDLGFFTLGFCWVLPFLATLQYIGIGTHP